MTASSAVDTAHKKNQKPKRHLHFLHRPGRRQIRLAEDHHHRDGLRLEGGQQLDQVDRRRPDHLRCAGVDDVQDGLRRGRLHERPPEGSDRAADLPNLDLCREKNRRPISRRTPSRPTSYLDTRPISASNSIKLSINSFFLYSLDLKLQCYSTFQRLANYAGDIFKAIGQTVAENQVNKFWYPGILF